MNACILCKRIDRVTSIFSNSVVAPIGYEICRGYFFQLHSLAILIEDMFKYKCAPKSHLNAFEKRFTNLKEARLYSEMHLNAFEKYLLPLQTQF